MNCDLDHYLSRLFKPWGSKVPPKSIIKDSLAFLIESREEWISSSGISCVSVVVVRMREKLFRNSGIGLDLMLVLSTERLSSLNMSLRRRLVSPMYCKWQRLH